MCAATPVAAGSRPPGLSTVSSLGQRGKAHRPPLRWAKVNLVDGDAPTSKSPFQFLFHNARTIRPNTILDQDALTVPFTIQQHATPLQDRPGLHTPLNRLRLREAPPKRPQWAWIHVHPRRHPQGCWACPVHLAPPFGLRAGAGVGFTTPATGALRLHSISFFLNRALEGR